MRSAARSARLAVLLVWAVIGTAFSGTGCCVLCTRPSPSDQQLARRVEQLIEKASIPGVKQVQASARKGLVTLGGIVETPEALQRAVVVAASDPHVRELSFLGVTFDPPELSDEEIESLMREAARQAIGAELADQLGYYCEDHFGVVYGTLPSLVLRQRLDEAMRSVKGIGPYFVAVEVVLEDPPPDDTVAAAVRRKLHNPLDVKNLLLIGSKIDVTVENNVVRLDGTVRNYLAKLVAKQQAERVEGVRYVINNLQVRGHTEPRGAQADQAAEDARDTAQPSKSD